MSEDITTMYLMSLGISHELLGRLGVDFSNAELYRNVINSMHTPISEAVA